MEQHASRLPLTQVQTASSFRPCVLPGFLHSARPARPGIHIHLGPSFQSRGTAPVGLWALKARPQELHENPGTKVHLVLPI